jgi:cytochrome c553
MTPRQTGTRALAGAALLMLGTAPDALAADDLQLQVLAASCANCHGTDGNSSGAIPRIGGRPQAALARQLRAFKAGTVEGITVMTRIATGYSDEQLDALARYFAERPRR